MPNVMVSNLLRVPTLSIPTSSPLPAATTGVAYSTTITAAGGTPAYAWSIGTNTPDTGSWSAINSSTGVISGTPQKAETETIVVDVVDSVINSATKTFSLSVASNLTITTSSPLPGATVGAAYSTTVAATGGFGAYTWSITANTPDTGSWSSINSSTGALSGTPGTAETESITVKVVDAAGNTASKTFSLTVSSSASGPPAFAAQMPVWGIVAQGGNTAPSMTQAAANRLAKSDLCWIGISYTSAGAQTFTGTADAYVKYIQSTSVIPTGTKVGNYYIPDSMGTRGDYPQLATMLSAWGELKSAAGVLTPNYFTNSGSMNNSSTYVPVVGGFRVEDGLTDFFVKYHIKGTWGGTSQSVDFMSTLDFGLHDNYQGQLTAGGYSSVNGAPADWNRDGTNDFSLEVTPVAGSVLYQHYQAGMLLSTTQWRAEVPNLYFMINAGTWGYSDPGGTNGAGNKTGGSSSSNYGVLFNTVHGGWIEGIDGLSWSGNGATIVQQLNFVLAHAFIPGYSIPMPGIYWNSSGFTAQNTTTAWQHPRAQLCMSQCARGVGVIAASSGGNILDYSALSWTWVDEMAVNPSTLVAQGEAGYTAAGKTYGGTYLDPAMTKTSNGVYYMRGTNSLGKIMVFMWNPQGSGAKTVTPSMFGPYTHFTALTGTQASGINNGATTTTHNLKDNAAPDGGGDGWVCQLT